MQRVVLNLARKAGLGAVSWYPDYMAAAVRDIQHRLRPIDLVLEVRDARIPLSSANEDLQDILSRKRRLLVLNKSDLANSNTTQEWRDHFEATNQQIVFVNAHNNDSVKMMLRAVRNCLADVIAKRPTLFIMVVGIPNVGKSALINAMHIMGHSDSSQRMLRKAAVGSHPGVTMEMAGFKIAYEPSIYVLDTPGVLVPNIQDLETGLKLALTGAMVDSVAGEVRLAHYLLALLNGCSAPSKWKCEPEKSVENKAGAKAKPKKAPVPMTLLELKRLAMTQKKKKKKKERAVDHNEDQCVFAVRKAITSTFINFDGNLEDECDMEGLVKTQMGKLREVFRIPIDSGDAGWTKVANKFLNLYRVGRLGGYTLDSVP